MARCAPPRDAGDGPRRAGSTSAGCRCSGPTSRARPNPVPAKAALLAMGLLERDDLRAPLLPLATAPRARLIDAAAHPRPRRRRRPQAARRRASRRDPASPHRRRGRIAGRRRERPRTAAVRPAVALVATILDDLDAGTRRAAEPDPAAPGGWRTDPEVKAAILACFRDRTTTTWDLGGALAFRDRAGLPLKRLLDGPEATAALEAGRPWRIVPGGTSVRAGVYLGPGVVAHAAVVRERRRVDRRGHDGGLARARRLVRPGRRARPPLGRRDDRRRARAGRRRGR